MIYIVIKVNPEYMILVNILYQISSNANNNNKNNNNNNDSNNNNDNNNNYMHCEIRAFSQHV